MKKTLLFCNGISGCGKSYFIQNTLPSGLFYNLRSATTRPMRPGESDGNPYFFRDENYFRNAKLATYLWVNERFWQPGDLPWLYGVPESEIFDNLDKNLVYDVIQPRYTRQMMDWFIEHKLDQEYEFKVAYFLPPDGNMNTVIKRANMPGDLKVRTTNTCTPYDFLEAGVHIDYILSPRARLNSPELMHHINKLAKQR